MLKRCLRALYCRGKYYCQRTYFLINKIRFIGDKWVHMESGVKIYTNVTLRRYPKKLRSGGIWFGKDSRIGWTRRSYWIAWYHKTRLFVWGEDAKIIVGGGAHLNGVHISARELVKIGNNTLIASGCQIMDYNGHVMKSKNRIGEIDVPSPVIIGNNVWVGLGVYILKGTTIGDNCVVGAGSVVKGIFPPNSLIMGNPAKVVKTFDLN